MPVIIQSSEMFSYWYSVVAIVLLSGIFTISTDAIAIYPDCKTLGKYALRPKIREFILVKVITAEPIVNQPVSITPGYDCILEGIARIELDRTQRSNICTGAGQLITEKFEDAKLPGYKRKDFIAKAVKSFHGSIGKMGVTGQFGCNFAADETKYKIACVFQERPRQ
ncbi:hypothetical protein ANCCAN_04106 [Ancylostoma caninum]|uniref:Uncharacterized protein n=1 Tax=Ancylostoma caninum TaxID=29170 RepID=A0A368GZR1_ANCCA|nr:hypothetical protein ANCCAN_04106 [Ancylostoma caninum]